MGANFTVKQLGKIHNIRILYSPSMVKYYGYKGGMATKVRLETELFGKKTVVIDDWTQKQKSFVKDFILNHEVGHIKHHDGLRNLLHFKNSQELLNARLNFDPRVLKMEFRADEFAAKEIGSKDAIKALKKIRSGLGLFNYFSQPGKEIGLRVKNLKNK